MTSDKNSRERGPRGRDVPCEICGIKHRYSWPDGSDWDGHAWSPHACGNTVYALRNAQRQRCETCQGTGVIVNEVVRNG